jgi:PAS domain S-box-containing protein
MTPATRATGLTDTQTVAVLEAVLADGGRAVIALDTGGRHTYVSPSAAALLGYEPADLLGRNSHARWHWQSDGQPYDPAACPICAACRDGDAHGQDRAMFGRRDGGLLPVEYRTLPCRQAGRLTGIIVSFSALSDAPATDEPAAVRPRVLLAEDSRVNQKLVSKLLGRLGCEVTVVGDGAAALATLAAGRWDLVLMDCEMPVLDGLAATRALRAAGQRVPVAAMTGHREDGDRECCLAAGMDDYLAKPVQPEALAALLARWAPRPG